MTTLRIARTFSIPLAEVSGLAVRSVGGRDELLAIGDTTAELARAELVDGVPGSWRVSRMEGVKDKQGSQLEAVAVSADGAILVLRENPPALFRLDASGSQVAVELHADVSRDPRWKQVRGNDPNSLGEGVAVGPDATVVLVKEKRPSAVLIVDVVGDVVVLQRHWLLASDLAERLRDLSDVAFGPDGRLFLISDQSGAIARVEPRWREADEVHADAVWALPKEVEKAEGLVVLADGRALVAVDRKKQKSNLFLLEPPLI